MKPPTTPDGNPTPEDPRTALKRDLRIPAPPPDEALCERIMDAVRQPEPEPARDQPWFPAWTGADVALAAAAAVTFLVWFQVRPGSSAPAAADRGPDPDDGPAMVLAQQEQDHLVSDTRKIAAFLSANLNL